MKNTKINNYNRSNWNSELRMTNHFIERYNSRVMDNHDENISVKHVIRDMDKKLTDREKNILSLYKMYKIEDVKTNNNLEEIGIVSSKIIVMDNILETNLDEILGIYKN